MKFSRSIVLAVALIFAWATAGFAAHSAEICQKRIESFNYLVDYSCLLYTSPSPRDA